MKKLGTPLLIALLAVCLFAGCEMPTDKPPPDKPTPPAKPKLSIADASVTEGDSGASNAVFSVTLNTAGAETATVSYATADGTATAGTDYQAASGTLTFAAGNRSQRITVVVNGDTVDEDDETFTITLRNPSQATLADAMATGTIIDDDASPEMFRDCPDCPELVVVPAGSFTMGSPSSEVGRDEDEVQAPVTIATPFAVGVHEITFAQWDTCVAAGGCARYRPDDQGWGHGAQPVINVSWDDAQQYVAWLSTKTGNQYRLLTEAEWEYVARADTTTPFHTGATISTDQANYDGLSTPYGWGQMGEYRARTIAVASFPANDFGLYDVHGNAAEWVEGCYDADAASGTCSRRVVRGGSWADPPQLLRSAYRGWCAPTLRNHQNGFRVARSITSP